METPDSLPQPVKTPPNPEQLRLRRNGIVIGIVTAILFAGVGVFSLLFPASAQAGDPALLITIYITFGVAVVGFLLTLLSLVGLYEFGSFLLIFIAIAASVVLQWYTRGQSGFISLILVMIVASLASATMRPGLARLAMVLAAIGALGAMALDYFLPFSRPSGDTLLTGIFSGVLALVFLFFVLRNFSRYRLQTKLIFASLVVALVASLLLTGFSLFLTNQTLNSSNQLKLQSSSFNTASSVDQFLKLTKDTLRSESSLSLLGEFLLQAEMGSPEPLLGQVEEVLSNYARKDSIFITAYSLTNARGVVVASTLQDEIGRLQDLEDFFQEPYKTGLPYVAPVRTDPVFSDFILVFASPVRSSDNSNFLGVLYVVYRASILQELISRDTGSAGEQSFAVLVDEDQVVLAHGANPTLSYRLVAEVELPTIANLLLDNRLAYPLPRPYHLGLEEVSQALKNTREQPYFESQESALEQPIVASSWYLGEKDWQLLFVQPANIANAPLDSQQRLLTLVTGLAVVAAVILALIISAFLVRPINRVTQIARELSSGNLAARADVETADEIGALAGTLNSMAGQLEDLIMTLEQRVAERTRALATSSDVSRRLSTILDQSELVKTVVEEVQSEFNYYHAHIYLFDDDNEYLRMVGGTGEAGRMMLERQHAIRAGKGLVGRAAETNQIVLVPDVSQAIGWLPNPLLPETRSEVAVPIAIGEKVVGVLDVQHNIVNGLTEDDADLLQSIANQVAIALQNALSYERTQRQAERDALVLEIGQKIQQAGSLDDVLKIAVRELGQALGASRARVQISLTPETPNGNKETR